MPYLLALAVGALGWAGISNAAENAADRVLPPKSGLTFGNVALVAGAVIGSLYLAKKVGLVK